MTLSIARIANLFVFVLAFGALSCASTAHAQPRPQRPPPQAQQAPHDDALSRLERDYRSATALLYAQTEDGGLRMMCTATAFERSGRTTRFVTASHCVAEDDTTHERVEVERTTWYITFDEPDNKMFYVAHVRAAGYQHRGDDFAVVEVELPADRTVPLMPLAAHDPILGENISNFASPLGLGKQLFRGHVSMEVLDRPVVSGDINWRGATLLQMSSGPGSSGSSIVSHRQRGIVAFLVGSITFRGSPNIVAIPVSKFRAFWTAAQAGTYRWYRAETADSGSGSSRSNGRGVRRLWNRIHVEGITYDPIGEEAPADQR